MGLGMHRGVQLYMHDRCHNAMICFPRQRFISQTEMVGGLKCFETCNVQGKEYRLEDQWSLAVINMIGTVIHLN
jgi:hypothetical protein